MKGALVFLVVFFIGFVPFVITSGIIKDHLRYRHVVVSVEIAFDH